VDAQLFRPPRRDPAGGGWVPGAQVGTLLTHADAQAHGTELSAMLSEKTGLPCVCALPSSVEARYYVVYTHGNSENLVSCAWFVKELCRVLHADVYALEYPGYFTNEEGTLLAEPSEGGCFDASAVFVGEVASREREGRGLPVVLVGYSLGCAIALHAADVHRTDSFPQATLLLAPFVSAASVVLAPTPWLLSLTSLYSQFDVFAMRTAALRNGHVLFVAHGTADEVIPLCHGRAIAQLAAKHSPDKVAFLEVPDATHASLRLHIEVIEQFLNFIKRQRP
jgi:pimeloyl-ACP methyl ester carboxylesterase